MRNTQEIIENQRLAEAMILTNDGGCGILELTDAGTCSVVWNRDEYGWEHVSISPTNAEKIPTWNDMCQLKDIFFAGDEEALQLHPKRGKYVNLKDNCLHLWKPRGIDIMQTLDACIAVFQILRKSGTE